MNQYLRKGTDRLIADLLRVKHIENMTSLELAVAIGFVKPRRKR